MTENDEISLTKCFCADTIPVRWSNNPLFTTVDDDIICTEKIIADRKTFFIDLKSNARGRVVRITEKVSSNRDRIMVPAEILDDFISALQDIRKANQEN